MDLFHGIIAGGLVVIGGLLAKWIYEKREEIKNAFINLKDTFMQYVWTPVYEKFLYPMFNIINDKIIQPTKNMLKGAGTWIYNTIIKPAWDKFVWLKDSVLGVFKTIGTVIGNFFGDSIRGVINSVLYAVETVINKFIKLINGALSVINAIPRSKHSKSKFNKYSKT